MAVADQPTGSHGVLHGSCQECGHTWAATTVKEPCPSCGSLKVTIAVRKDPKAKRSNF